MKVQEILKTTRAHELSTSQIEFILKNGDEDIRQRVLHRLNLTQLKQFLTNTDIKELKEDVVEALTTLFFKTSDLEKQLKEEMITRHIKQGIVFQDFNITTRDKAPNLRNEFELIDLAVKHHIPKDLFYTQKLISVVEIRKKFENHPFWKDALENDIIIPNGKTYIVQPNKKD